MGDRGIRVALDAIEAARAANGAGPRHHIAHLSMVQPDDAKRFGPLGITANIQGLWAAPDPFVDDDDRAKSGCSQGYPFRTMPRAGPSSRWVRTGRCRPPTPGWRSTSP